MYEENRTLDYINIKYLNLKENTQIINMLHSLKTGEEKILFISSYLENNIEIVDIF